VSRQNIENDPTHFSTLRREELVRGLLCSSNPCVSTL
jgi:hypothetical protein